MKKTNNKTKFTRETLIYIFVFTVFLLIIGKLFLLQVIHADELRAKGLDMKSNLQEPIIERGTIYDFQHNILAKSIETKDVYADTKNMNELLPKRKDGLTKDTIAAQLAPLLGKSSDEILALLHKDSYYIVLTKNIDLDHAQKIKQLGFPGINFSDSYKRVYPMGNTASSVLGIVDATGHGIEGVEKTADQDLLNVLDDENRGNNIVLTIDSTIQYLLEQELDGIVGEYSPKRTTILAMDPMTGKILGMGSRPTFDPNDYRNTKNEDRKNLGVSMIYEPGSTFKIITGSIGLEENIISPEEKFDDPGYLNVGSRTITNWDSDRKPHGLITFSDGMRLSSNVVLALAGQKIGKETFYTYLKSFGFGTKTKVDLSGEEQGLLIDQSRVKDLELSTMAFGQANLVTPVQLLTAISSVANGGTLYQPYVIDRVLSTEGKILKQNEPKTVRKILSPKTCREMNDILVNVVENGTGASTKIEGIKVAGKTGTAQKIDPVTLAYSETDKIASFVAYAPADNPKIAVLAILDTPKGDFVQGGVMAGPHVKKILEGALQYYGIPVSSDTPSDVNNFLEGEATRPQPKTVTPEREPVNGEVMIPDLTGLTIRKVGEELGKLELRYKFQGSGTVTKQFPEPGKIVNKGDCVEVVFSGQT
nr:penicillin-binding transpeptidase domain-containing protein [Syntrophobotulus glycolicus]